MSVLFTLTLFIVLLMQPIFAQSNSGPSILKHNSIEFSGGTVIADEKPEDLAIEVPLTIDFDEYRQFVFGQQIPEVGTLNINIGASRQFVTGEWQGIVLTPPANHFQGIRGLSPASIKFGGDGASSDPNAWSHMQIGTSNYGTSIWIRLHEDGEAMEIGGYNNIQRDSLEPVNPIALGLQMQTARHGNVNIQNKLYVVDGNVGVNTNSPDEALHVNGSINLGSHKLLGKVGEVRFRSTTSDTIDLPNSGADTLLATFDMTSGTNTNPNEGRFSASLKGLAVGSIIHRIEGVEGSSTSWMVILENGVEIARSVPMSFDFQVCCNKRNSYNHFSMFPIVANRTYTIQLWGKLSNSLTSGTDLTSSLQTFTNKRAMIYAIPAAQQ